MAAAAVLEAPLDAEPIAAPEPLVAPARTAAINADGENKEEYH